MPKVIWRQDNETRTTFNSVEEFELHLAQSVPLPFGLMLNIIYAITQAIESYLEQKSHASAGSYRGIFYRRFGPFNSAIDTLRQVLGPNEHWGITRVVHQEGEAQWPHHYDLD